MTLQDYVRILQKRGWIILLLLVMTAASAFAFSKLQTPIYKSSVDILIQPARADLGLTESTKSLLRSYVSWMNTNTRAQKVIDLLNLDRLPGDLRSDVTIASDESRLVIQLTVEDADGDLANDIAQTWTDLFVQWRNEENDKQNVEDRVDAIQLDPPRYGLARPKWKINTLAGAIFGVLVGGTIVFVLEWIESGVVRRPEDVDRYLGLPLLGTIPAPKIEVSRPYLLGKTTTTGSAMPPKHPALQETTVVKPMPPLASPPTSPSSLPERAVSDDPLAKRGEDAGPIEPTILRSKGDEV